MSARTVTCPCCGQNSEVTYRCEHCGRDLAGENTTEGMQR